MDSPKTVAVLGTGIMGSGMARNLLEAGFRVNVWNRTREKTRGLEEQGATAAPTPGEAVADASIVITMLADAHAVEQAMGTDGGTLQHLGPEHVWIQMGTVGLAATDWCAEQAQVRSVPFVDAPVLGTRAPAEKGELVVLASGPHELEEPCRPIFDAIGRRTLWLGPAGAGTRLKLVANNWILGLLETLAESIALSERLDIDPELFLEAIEGGPVDAPYARIKGDMMRRRSFEPSFPLTHAHKDGALILDAAREHGLDLEGAKVYTSRLERAKEAGLGGEDMAAVIRTLL